MIEEVNIDIMADKEKPPEEEEFYLIIIGRNYDGDLEHHLNLTKKELNAFIKDKSIGTVAEYYIYHSTSPLRLIRPTLKFE